MGKHAMKLQEINLNKTKNRMNKVMESRFGFSVDYDNLTVDRAQRLVQAIGEGLNRIKNSSSFHSAEKNPKYMELLVVHESLTDWLSEQMLVESEMGKSEVVLAAKDMVDSMQDMVEKASKMQNEQMPALLDSIRDQIGSAQADMFKNQMAPLLDSLIEQLSSAREAADAAARTVAGEQVSQPMTLPAEELSDVSLDQETDLDQDEFSAADAAAGGPEELGRERR
jgi:hypothetical protein